MKRAFGFILFSLLLTTLFADTGDIYKSKDGAAINGYDVVSYFAEDSPLEGKAKYSYEYDGATFLFASAENKNAFQKNPEKYMPECGGYCAFAVAAMGKKVPTNPETYKIKDGKLYLFFNGKMEGKMTNTLPMWNEKEAAYLSTIDKNWNKLQTTK